MERLTRCSRIRNTVLIIEHNLDVIKLVDYIIDIGPEGGQKGGQLIAKGVPETIINDDKSHTAKFLKKNLITYEERITSQGME